MLKLTWFAIYLPKFIKAISWELNVLNPNTVLFMWANFTI